MAISGVENIKQYIRNLPFDEDLKKVGSTKHSLNPSRYNLFLKIIKTSGEEISGQVSDFGNYHLCIEPPMLRPIDPGRKIESFHWIPIDDISSITPLDTSYPPKFAHEWTYRKSTDKGRWPVEIIQQQEPKRLVGVIEYVFEESVQGNTYAYYLFPIQYLIKTDPKKPPITVDISEIISLRDIEKELEAKLPI